MLCTTLGYLEKDRCYLMLHRIKKKNDISHDKWIGIGGKIEEGESPLQGMLRECLEESGLIWKDPQLRAVITFNYRENEESPLFCEQMFLFSGSEFSGELKECEEGVLEWVPFEKISSLPLWQGDLLFFTLMEKQAPFFFLTLEYLADKLLSVSLNNISLDPSDPDIDQKALAIAGRYC